jgi:inner membrane protein
LLAIAADLDFVPGIFVGRPNLYHQEISHSLGFTSIVSLGFALIYGLRKGTVWGAWGWFFLAYASHLVIDLFGRDTRPPYGIPLFWPISGEHYLAPRPIFWGVHHAAETSASTSKWLVSILTPRNLEAIGIEVMVTLPVILSILLVQYFHSRE